jgi:hypothetical protein
MVALAVVLLILVAAFTIAVFLGNPNVLELSIFGAHVPVTAAGVYANGAGAMLILVVALSLLRRGVRRGLRRRKQVRTLRTVANSTTRDPLPQNAGARRTEAGRPRQDQPAQTRPDDQVAPTAPVASSPKAGTGPQSTAASPERQSLLERADEPTADGADR